MTKKDYELIAMPFSNGLTRERGLGDYVIVHNNPTNMAVAKVAIELCHDLKMENPRFDSKKFLMTCWLFDLPEVKSNLYFAVANGMNQAFINELWS